ncbi:NlpC/P60 family protein [Corynebacterium sp. A21]|uniref:NlpC/P60 family protein n=1 Tax=Corynebacterium sp. A21 TaxID=3457318 RepID=UPI003FD1AABA
MVAATIAALLALSCLEAVPTAKADELADLIATMEEVSREAAEKNEEVKQLELDIASGEEGLSTHQLAVERAFAEVADSRAAVLQLQESVNQVAGARYRISLIDPITLVFSSESPQKAIDRTAYLDTLTRKHTAVVDDLGAANEAAAENHQAASRASAEAEFQLGQLAQQRVRLSSEQSELQERIQEIQAQVDTLDRAAREQWENKNNPIEGVNLSDLVGSPEAVAAVQAAMSKLGAPYGWGATGPDTFDCSGLIYWAYQQQGKSVPRTSQAQMAGGTAVTRGELQPGDVVGYFPGATHVGLYIGQGMIVHASDYGIPVQVVSVDSMPWHGASRF